MPPTPHTPSPTYASAERGEVRHRGGSGGILKTYDRGVAHDVDGGEDAGDATLQLFWHRAGWLVMLLMCQSTSSVILEHFTILLQKHPVVIYFLTMLVGAGGNAGGQSTVLVVRRLALAAARSAKGDRGSPELRLSMRRIVGAEISVGARLALVLFVAAFIRCIVFKVRGKECLAICLSMLVIVFTSTLIGAALPVLLSRLRIDPAHAGATIQVIMDISGVSLTCVVSCWVLGLPVGGGVQVISNATVLPESPMLQQQYHLSPLGASWCDFGANPEENWCFAAATWALQDLGVSPLRRFFVVTDPSHLGGCSVLDAGYGAWQVHFNRASGTNAGEYSLICGGHSTTAQPIRLDGGQDLSAFGTDGAIEP